MSGTTSYQVVAGGRHRAVEDIQRGPEGQKRFVLERVVADARLRTDPDAVDDRHRGRAHEGIAWRRDVTGVEDGWQSA